MTNYHKEATLQQQANLLQLALHVGGLPTEYEHFDMVTWFSEQEQGIVLNPAIIRPQDYHECGTVACFLGHGPSAGIEPSLNVYSWRSYADLNFGIDSTTHIHDWLFGGQWSDHQPTAREAAARAFYILEHGDVPEAWEAEVREWGHSPESIIEANNEIAYYLNWPSFTITSPEDFAPHLAVSHQTGESLVLTNGDVVPMNKPLCGSCSEPLPAALICPRCTVPAKVYTTWQSLYGETK